MWATIVFFLPFYSNGQLNFLINDLNTTTYGSVGKSSNCEIYFAGGCFWGTEHFFKQIRGVVATEVGYANGHTNNPTYEAIVRNNTGYVETVKVTYDPEIVEFELLLDLFFLTIDPTSVNKQGNDTGDQYRTGIYYTSEIQLSKIRSKIKNEAEKYSKPIVVEVTTIKKYFTAEDDHQNYLENNPNGYCHKNYLENNPIGYCHINHELINLAKNTNQKGKTKNSHNSKSKTMLNWNDVITFATNQNPIPDRRVEITENEWKTRLTPEQFRVTRKHGTERSFSHDLCRSYDPGLYSCVCCSNLLFDSSEKFDSGTGWPSFTQPIRENSVKYIMDTSFGMDRVEVQCNVCDAHLGHVFPDGPAPSGLRYCMNGEALVKAKE